MARYGVPSRRWPSESSLSEVMIPPTPGSSPRPSASFVETRRSGARCRFDFLHRCTDEQLFDVRGIGQRPFAGQTLPFALESLAIEPEKPRRRALVAPGSLDRLLHDRSLDDLELRPEVGRQREEP